MHRITLRAAFVLALLPVVALAQTAIPEPDIAGLGSAFLLALSTKNYGILLSATLLGAVALARFVASKFPGKFATWLTTAQGSAVLALLGGSASLLLGALRAGQELSAGLVLSCVGTALTASGLWSIGKALGEKAPDAGTSMAPEQCSAADIANGKPGCPR